MADEIVAPVVPPAAAPQEPATFSREYVSELRHESASNRKAKQDAEAKLTAAEALAKTATDEATAKIATAQAAADQRIIRAELKAEALKAGMVDLDGLKLADLSKVKLNEAGEVEGADALMTELKKAKPYLFGNPGTTSNTSTTAPKPSPAQNFDASIASKEEYQKQRDNIRRGILPTLKA